MKMVMAAFREVGVESLLFDCDLLEQSLLCHLWKQTVDGTLSDLRKSRSDLVSRELTFVFPEEFENPVSTFCLVRLHSNMRITLNFWKSQHSGAKKMRIVLKSWEKDRFKASFSHFASV